MDKIREISESSAPKVIYFGQFLNTAIYDLKITFGCTGASPEIICQNIRRKYEYFDDETHFWPKNMAASQLP